MIDLGVLVTETRWRQLRENAPPGWWVQEAERERRLGVRQLLACAASVDLDGAAAQVLWAGEHGVETARVSPLPHIWHNQVAVPGRAEARLLRQLNGRPDLVVFNETNRYDRVMLLEMLAANPEVEPYLAPALAEPDEPGIYLLAPRRRAMRHARYAHAQEPGVVRHLCPCTGERGEMQGRLRDLLPFLSPNGALSRLPGWPVGGLEWRFYLRRDGIDGWVGAGAVAKWDALREHGRRERCWPLDLALNRHFGGAGAGLGAEMARAARLVAETVSLFQPGLVHCAVDFWVAEPEQIVLADLAGRYRMDWLARTGQSAALTGLQDHPLQFARLLVEMGVEKLHVDYGRGGAGDGAGSRAAGHGARPGDTAAGDAAVRDRADRSECGDPCPDRGRNDC